MSKYQIAHKTMLGQMMTTIVRIDDMAWIPCDPTNTDYQDYLAWVAEGNIAEEWSPDAN